MVIPLPPSKGDFISTIINLFNFHISRLSPFEGGRGDDLLLLIHLFLINILPFLIPFAFKTIILIVLFVRNPNAMIGFQVLVIFPERMAGPVGRK